MLSTLVRIRHHESYLLLVIHIFLAKFSLKISYTVTRGITFFLNLEHFFARQRKCHSNLHRAIRSIICHSRAASRKSALSRQPPYPFFLSHHRPSLSNLQKISGVFSIKCRCGEETSALPSRSIFRRARSRGSTIYQGKENKQSRAAAAAKHHEKSGSINACAAGR